MPILYVHGVGIREGGQQGSNEARLLLKGIDWPSVQGRLRQWIAPVLNPAEPAKVLIEEAYWGDLGASPLLPKPDDILPVPSQLSATELAEQLEAQLRRVMPMRAWPEVIQAVWNVASNQTLRQAWDELPAAQQWDALQRSTEGELHRQWSLKHPLLPWPWLAQWRQDIHVHLMQRVTHLRGPMESFLPYFMGDILEYLLRRGTPQHLGPIPELMLGHLSDMQKIKRQTGEPIVVLTHSMGGQLMYDALSAYAPAQADLEDLKVDFWCAAASQLGLFASLNLFVQHTSPQGSLPPLGNLDYLWNVWSPTDLLSFQSGGAIPHAHDISMSLTGDAFRAHIEYIISPLFFEIFASKLQVRLAAGAAN